MKATELLKSPNREEAALLEKLDPRRFPEHLAIIMDGNGRWAERRHYPRVAGHRAGVDSARTVIETCTRLGLPALTLYAFSLENWRRPKAEIDFLMRLLRQYLQDRAAGHASQQYSPAGDRPHRSASRRCARATSRRAWRLPRRIPACASPLRSTTAAARSSWTPSTPFSTRVAGKASTATACRHFRVDEQMIADHLYTAGLPDPGSADSHQRRNARQQFPSLADRLRRNLRHRNSLAGLLPRANSTPRWSITRNANGATAVWRTAPGA